jgi:FdhD protein
VDADSLARLRTVKVTRVSSGGVTHGVDAAATEEPLEIRLHGRPFVTIMRTPGDDRALAAGFLLSERVIRSRDDLGAVEHCRHPDHREAHHVVDVFLVGDAATRVAEQLEARRHVVTSSACGVCGRATIDDLRASLAPLAVDWTVELPFVRALPARLRETQAVFEETGGLHGAAIVARSGELLSSAEDVGRHNAVDKAIGRLLLVGGAAPAALLVSGRVAFEIVQ